jgi:D-inositol-3-phosphate glycosyltransferase
MSVQVFHFISHINGGGAESAVRDLVKHQNNSVSVNLITFNAGGFNVDCDSNIHLIKGNCTFIKVFKFAKLLYQLKNRFGDQLIIHTHLTWALYLTCLIRSFTKFKHIHTEHSVTTKRRKIWFKNIEIFVYRSLDAVIYVSEAAKGSLETWVGKSNVGRSAVIYNLFDLSNFNLKKSYDRPQTHFLSVGRLVKSKGFDKTILAFSKLEHLNYEYHIVGEGVENKRLQSLINDYALNERIFIHPWTNDISDFYHSSDILLIPSKFESFGLVSLEAQACGLHVLAADIDGLRETAVIEKLFHTVSDPEIINSWQIAITKFIALRRLGCLSEDEHANFRRFTSHTILHEYWNIYAKVINEHKFYK